MSLVNLSGLALDAGDGPVWVSLLASLPSRLWTSSRTALTSFTSRSLRRMTSFNKWSAMKLASRSAARGGILGRVDNGLCQDLRLGALEIILSRVSSRICEFEFAGRSEIASVSSLSKTASTMVSTHGRVERSARVLPSPNRLK
jgi:hypothetical protein